MNGFGIESKTAAFKLSESNSTASCDDTRTWVAAEYLAVKELIPGPQLSDQAAKIMLNSLEAIAREVGRERFHQTTLRVIDTCERRPTIATYRKLAGLNTRLGPQEEALAKCWELVTVIVTRFLGTDSEGNVAIRARVTQRAGEFFEENPPYLPPSVVRAVHAMGGWKALQESYPNWHAQRFSNFKELLILSQEETTALLGETSTALATR